MKEFAEWIGIGGLGPVLVGGPSTVADLLQEWVHESDVDGFNLAYAVTPESFEEVVTHIGPELQKRGVYKTENPTVPRSEKLFGAGR